MATDTIAGMLLTRLGDGHPGVRTTERSYTWDETVRRSAARGALARALRVEGRPFHVGVLLENVPEFLFWLGGAALAGATVVGINPTRRGAELAAEVRHTDCQLLVTDRAGLALLDGLDVGVGRERFLLVDDPEYHRLLARHTSPPAAEAAVTPRTQLLLLLTSGTTGTAKAARCSQGRLAALGHANAAKYAIGREDVSYCCMPLFHGNALMGLWAPSLASGAEIALTPRFSASGFLPDVRRFGATYFTYVGKALGYVMATEERPDDAENTLTHGFGTEASPEDKAGFARRFGCRLIEVYGSSEGSGAVRQDPEAPPGALGRPARPAVQVVDPETLVTCPAARLDEHGGVRNAEEAVGEIVVKDGADAFEGYYRNEAADAERVRHGWYWTGDLGYVDAAGFLYFAGRAGDWIRVDGENTSALRIEQVLRRHPDVVAAGVYAVPDPRSGDRVMAALELREGAGFDPAELAAFLAEQQDLGTKQAPHLVRVSRRLPATGSDKVRKPVLKAEAWLCEDPVYERQGRGKPVYRPLDAARRAALREEFTRHGRQRFLPGPG